MLLFDTFVAHPVSVAGLATRLGELCDGGVTCGAARAAAGPPAGEPYGPAGGPRCAAQTRNGMIRRATMFATLIIGLIAGPAVSL